MSMHNSGRNDTKNPGGSVGFDRLKAVYTPTNVPDSKELQAEWESRTPEQTLGDYVARKQRAAGFDEVRKECCGNPLRNGGCKDCPPKLTFEEWYSQSGWAARTKMLMLDPESLKKIIESTWKAAQENV